MIKDNEYEALVEIVGPKNVSRAPVILDNYAFQWCAELINIMNDKPLSRYYYRPVAVI